jgi:hypothetical protein
MLSVATVDQLGGIGAGSPNRLLFSNIDALAHVTGDAQLLADPSFDFGTTFWTADICTIVNSAGCPPGDSDQLAMASFTGRSGTGHATIGGSPKSFHLSSEVVTIPSNVKKAELSFYLWIVTKDPATSRNDVLTIEVQDPSGRSLAILGSYSNLDANATYTRRAFDVSRFRGMPIRIGFTGIQAVGPPTYFVLDDAELNIWK